MNISSDDHVRIFFPLHRSKSPKIKHFIPGRFPGTEFSLRTRGYTLTIGFLSEGASGSSVHHTFENRRSATMLCKKMAHFLFGLSALCLLGFVDVAPASAHMHPHGEMMMQGGPIPFYLMNQDRIGLSKDQVAKLLKLKESFLRTAIMEKARIRVLHLDVMEHMMHHRIDTATVRKDMDQILSHKRTLMHGYLDMISRAHAVLTAQQFDKVKRLWREMMMMHHEMMMGPHHGPMDHRHM
ncbi:hypothetical protein Y981_04455 [Leptospirillum ferriphilum YSK]|uniref:Periplasmic heavy metal sensor n=3 Tax=Leptospirillum ferriphilum TaxID=178606 RepID=A0A059XYM4_9BACT|nr:hypothetical protein Y981_04455 [Leptospirillum ferriphilum YSK]